MKITSEIVLSLLEEAFEAAWKNRGNIWDNAKRSSYFVSQLSESFVRVFPGKALVQSTDELGQKKSGEWLLDIAIVSEQEVGTEYRNRKAKIVHKIKWAIESEFSTNLTEFCRDFSKLLHIRSEAYLYIAGLNQLTEKARVDYIDAQVDLAKTLVRQHGIVEPFFFAFVPTPGKSGLYDSVWDSGLSLADLQAWFHVERLSPGV